MIMLYLKALEKENKKSRRRHFRQRKDFVQAISRHVANSVDQDEVVHAVCNSIFFGLGLAFQVKGLSYHTKISPHAKSFNP